MKKAIILHGMPSQETFINPQGESESNSHWLPWIQHELVLGGILAQTPELPVPYAPIYDAWKTVFDQFELDDDILLIGHSCGAGFLLRWLSEHDVRVGQVILVAPFIDPTKQLPAHGLPDFFDFTLDSELTAKTTSLTVFLSDNETHPEVVQSVEIIREKIAGIKFIELSGYGHFVSQDMRGREFKELRAEIQDLAIA
jgi:predicted alpha/beta hydrolase family esterase